MTKKETPKEEEKAPTEDVRLSPKEYEEIMQKAKELTEIKDNMLRSAADYENAKKRLMRERDEFVRFNQEKLIKEMLAVLDNFERALSHIEDVDDETSKGIVDGIQLVFKQLLEILKNQGLTRMKTAGETFDPHLHEAIGYVQEEGKEDEIIDEVQPGYMLHDRLIRAAKVRVRIAPAPAKDKDAD